MTSTVFSPDQVSLGVLVTAVPRDAVDGAVAACGVADRRSGGKLPAHVVAYLTMGLCLFADDDDEEVATKVTGALSSWGCWDASWSVPTSGGISHARKRLGRNVLAEVFERVAQPVGGMFTRGCLLRQRRLLAIDGFEVDVPDTEGNAAEFGYAGSGESRSAFPKARVVALAECGTHAFVAAEVGAWSTGERSTMSCSSPACRFAGYPAPPSLELMFVVLGFAVGLGVIAWLWWRIWAESRREPVGARYPLILLPSEETR